MDSHEPIWRKSSYSQPEGPNCVEVKLTKIHVEIRDSHGKTRNSIRLNKREWIAFIANTKQE